MVERQLCKLEVKGSSPLFSTRPRSGARFFDMMEGDTSRRAAEAVRQKNTRAQERDARRPFGSARHVMSFGYAKYPRAHGGCLGSRRR